MSTPFAWSQSQMGAMFNPFGPKWTVSYTGELHHHFEADLEDSEDGTEGIAITETETQLRFKFHEKEREAWFLGVDTSYWDLSGDANFDESGARLPGELYALEIGVGYRDVFKERGYWGGYLSIGSASDEPFDSADELYIRGTGFIRIPSDGLNGWIVGINADSTRDIPIVAGPAYSWVNAKRSIVLGLPFANINWRPKPEWRFSFNYAPIHRLSVRAAYRPNRKTELYALARWQSRRFWRADRPDEDDVLAFVDKRALAGVSYKITRQLTGSVEGGYAFDREFGEGDDISDRADNNIDLDNTWFVGVRVNGRF